MKAWGGPYSFVSWLLALVLLAGIAAWGCNQSNRKEDQLPADMSTLRESHSTHELPAIDRQVPARSETATFALG